MKRHGNLFDKIVSFRSLPEAINGIGVYVGGWLKKTGIMNLV